MRSEIPLADTATDSRNQRYGLLGDLLDRELCAVYERAGSPAAWRLFRQDVKHVETPEMPHKTQDFLCRHLRLAPDCAARDELQSGRKTIRRPTSAIGCRVTHKWKGNVQDD